MSRRNWTPEDRQKAWRLHCSGQTLKQIGAALNRSTDSVDTCLRVLRRAKETKKRPCLCCGKPFSSAGPQNRLCGRCAGRSISPYAL